MRMRPTAAVQLMEMLMTPLMILTEMLMVLLMMRMVPMEIPMDPITIPMDPITILMDILMGILMILTETLMTPLMMRMVLMMAMDILMDLPVMATVPIPLIPMEVMDTAVIKWNCRKKTEPVRRRLENLEST